MFRSKSPVMSLVAGLFSVLMTPAACGAVGSPSANADHGPPAPANGDLEGRPARPKGMPDNFLELSWHVAAYNAQGKIQKDHPAIVRITATSNAPIQGNVHGPYPLRVYTNTPYTHTIWYEPGVQIQTDLTATADPILPDGWYLECTATSAGQLIDAHDFSSDPMICIMSHTIQG